MIKIAIQGVAGCFHEQAARKYFLGKQVEAVPCESFPKLFEALDDDDSLLGIIAIENTIAGALLQNHELLRKSQMRVIGEYKLRIEHMVAALPGQKIEDLHEIGSHPIALMQCQKWLQKHPAIKVVEKEDTAATAQEIAKGALEGHAAICGELAAELYGLEILSRSVESNKRNFTRFLILAPETQAAEMIDPKKNNKSSLVFTLGHASGALSKVLTIFSFYEINLTKIQSMPLIGREWEYQFYVDLSYDDAERYRQSIEATRPFMNYLKILGEYESYEIEE